MLIPSVQVTSSNLFEDEQLDKMLGKLNSIPNNREQEREDLLDTLHPEYNAERPHDLSGYTEEGYRLFRARLMSVLATMKYENPNIRLDNLKGYGSDLYTLKREIAVHVTDVLNNVYGKSISPTRDYEDIKVPGIATITTYRQEHKYFYFISHVVHGHIYGDDPYESRHEAIGWAIERLIKVDGGA